MSKSPDDAEVYTITAAQRGLSREQVGRTRKYLISMGIRTACVIAAIFVPGWPKWIFIVELVLPYLAVVVANAGRENDEPGQVGPVAHDALPLQLEATGDVAQGGPIIVASTAADPRRG